jgi:hypothetical protein
MRSGEAIKRMTAKFYYPMELYQITNDFQKIRG